MFDLPRGTKVQRHIIFIHTSRSGFQAIQKLATIHTNTHKSCMAAAQYGGSDAKNAGRATGACCHAGDCRGKISAVDLSVRTAMTFKVNEEGCKTSVAGFEMNRRSRASKGANLAITLIDYLVQDLRASLPPRSTVAMNIPSKKTATSEAVGMVIGGFILRPVCPDRTSTLGPPRSA
jgi:hypothetical protein